MTNTTGTITNTIIDYSPVSLCLIHVLSGWQHGNPAKAGSLSRGLVVPFYSPCYIADTMITLTSYKYNDIQHTKQS